jgi:hypothetical protein
MPWTDYGKSQIFAIGITPPAAAVQLYVALFSTSADPAGPPVELALAGYARQLISFGVDVADTATSLYDISFGPLAAGSYTGIGIYDDPLLITDHCWMWNDESGPITIPASSTVDFPAAQILAVRSP